LKNTFRHGVHPKDNKDVTKNIDFETMPTGPKVFIPLSQHVGAPAVPVVEEGALVKAGTLIGKASGNVSANIHSSVSGKIVGFEPREDVRGIKTRHVVIENDGLYEEERLPALENPTAEAIVERVKAAGVVGMGGATFPTHIKLETKQKIDTLIINGSECEPYITTDYRMMLDFPEKIIEGIGYLKIALGAANVVVGIEDNKEEAIASMTAAVKEPSFSVCALKTKYPQGGEKQLIYAIGKKVVPAGALPSDVGYIVLNISTAYSVYEAVKLGRPCFSRYMTVGGKGVKRPANIYVRNGVPFSEIIDYLGVSDSGFVKAVSGGPMMGISLDNLTPVVYKGSTALLLLAKDEIRAVEPSPCINCGRCHRACPMSLFPMMTDKLILLDKIDEAEKFYPNSCIECGSCAYVCPAKRPLVQSQRLAKKLLKERKK